MNDLKEMTTEELDKMFEAISAELKARENTRRDELIKNVCDAVNKLMTAFPNVRLLTEIECEDCYSLQPLDVLDCFNCGCEKGLTPRDFSW